MYVAIFILNKYIYVHLSIATEGRAFMRVIVESVNSVCNNAIFYIPNNK